MPKTLVLWNPTSGRAQSADEVYRRLHETADTTVRETAGAEEAMRWAQNAGEEGYEVVVAAGGDGTINAAVCGLDAARTPVRAPMSKPVTMAVLPTGTANDLAFTLGIPDDLEQAAQLIFSGQTRVLDLVELDTHRRQCFINIATGGNSRRVTEVLTDEIKQSWGPLCYLRGAVDFLDDLQSFRANVAFDEEDAFPIDLWNVVVANGRTNAGRLQIAPRANPEDGLLDVVLIKDGTMLDFAALTAQFALADYLESDQVIYRQVRQVTINSQPPMPFTIDGEAIDEQPVHFRVKRGALPVIVGDAYSATPPESWF